MIDLHCHSSFSDGLLTPDALLTKALDAGVSVLALTDHDTVAGLSPLREAASRQSSQTIQLIDGIEFSVRWKLHDIHIIGLNINKEQETLRTCIALQEHCRIERARQIGEYLAYVVPDAYAKACELAGHERVGRPHFAQLLVNKRIVSDMQQAFRRFLAKGRPAYVPTLWLSLERVIEAIVEAGGQAVIAHPLKYKLTRSKLNALITSFKDMGGVGMEVVSGSMTTSDILDMAGLCHRFELLASTGSDYHGEGVSRLGLGRQNPLPAGCNPIWHQWAIH